MIPRPCSLTRHSWDILVFFTRVECLPCGCLRVVHEVDCMNKFGDTLLGLYTNMEQNFRSFYTTCKRNKLTPAHTRPIMKFLLPFPHHLFRCTLRLTGRSAEISSPRMAGTETTGAKGVRRCRAYTRLARTSNEIANELQLGIHRPWRLRLGYAWPSIIGIV